LKLISGRARASKTPRGCAQSLQLIQNGYQIIVGRFGRFRLRRSGVSLFLWLSAM